MGRTPGPKTVAVEASMDATCLMQRATDSMMWALKHARDAQIALREMRGVLEGKRDEAG
jgi:hypothetical protein